MIEIVSFPPHPQYVESVKSAFALARKSFWVDLTPDAYLVRAATLSTPPDLIFVDYSALEKFKALAYANPENQFLAAIPLLVTAALIIPGGQLDYEASKLNFIGMVPNIEQLTPTKFTRYVQAFYAAKEQSPTGIVTRQSYRKALALIDQDPLLAGKPANTWRLASLQR